MGVLDADLITRLVRATNDSKPEKNEGVLYGTVVDDGIRKYVHLDGSDGSVNTPVVTTTDIKAGDTVLVQLKNHTATVTGNITDPAIGVKRAEGIESSITQTASEIRLEVKNEISKVSSRITQTASEIRAEVTDEVDGLNSLISQTASEIRSEVTDEVNGLNSLISQTASEIRSEVSNSVSGLSSKIAQTENAITSIVKDQEGFSQFKQTVEGFSFMGKGGTVKISGGDLTLTGAIKWADLANDAKSQVNTANTNASNAVTTANTANTNASNAVTTANTANNTANTANNTANSALTEAAKASNSAGSAFTKAATAEQVAAEAKQIAQSMSLPEYLKSTYIDETTIMSPSIFGGQFYAIDTDSYIEMNGDGLYMYTDGITVPKASIVNKVSNNTITFSLGAGDNKGNNYFYIRKFNDQVDLVYITTDGEKCGFSFFDDGTIKLHGEWM